MSAVVDPPASPDPPSDAARQHELAQILLTVQSLVLSADDVDAFLRELAVLGAGVVGPDASCGITLRHDDRPTTVASSDDRATALDETQFVSVGGPGLLALESGQTVSVADVDTDSRWPEYFGFARQQGLRCSLSIPLEVAGSPVGVMTFYAFHDRSVFDLAHQAAAAIFAAQVAGAIQLVRRRVSDAVLVGQLEHALTSRSTIDQALGIVMAQQSCSADEAFAVLRARSQNSQRKLREVAAELTEQVSKESGSAEPGPQGNRLR